MFQWINSFLCTSIIDFPTFHCNVGDGDKKIIIYIYKYKISNFKEIAGYGAIWDQGTIIWETLKVICQTNSQDISLQSSMQQKTLSESWIKYFYILLVILSCEIPSKLCVRKWFESLMLFDLAILMIDILEVK